MRPSVVVCLLLAAACTYEADLLPCGDLLCPTHTTCVVDRCVTPAQLASCADKAPDEPCAVDARVGVCQDGACTYVGCGNGVVEPGETCDDANTTYNDGCSADCRSLEICGNGIIDYAAGESCDCGTDASTQPERCTTPNSEDPAAECSLDCALRFCGDAELNTLEQCDGEQLGDAACTDFGYYHGAPTCSAGCLLEVASCYGRCGDADVEPAFGEFCDGSAPAGSCVTYGFDAGLPACSAACSPDFSDCERFGLVQHDSRAAIAFELSKGVPIVLAAAPENGSNAYALINGVRIFAPEGNYTALVNDGTRTIAVSSGHLAVWNDIAWVLESVGWPATTTPPSGAWASKQLGLFVAIDGTLWRYSGTWAQQALTGIIGVHGSEDTVFAWSATQAWSSTAGAAYTSESLPNIGAHTLRFVAKKATGPRWVIAGTGLVSVIHANATGAWVNATISVRSGTLDADGNLLLAGTGGAFHARVSGGILPSVVAFTPNAQTVTRSPDGGLAIASVNGTVSQRTGAWNELDLILSGYAYDPYENDRFALVDVTNNGTTVTSSTANYAAWMGSADGPSHYPYDLNYVYTDDVSALPDGSLVLATSGGLSDTWGTGIYDSSRYDGDGNYLGYFPVFRLDATRTGKVLACGDQVLARITDTTSIDVFYFDDSLPDISFRAADEASDGTVVALGFDGQHRIVRIAADGTPTVLATTTPLNDIWVSPAGDAIAAGGNQVYHCPAQATTCTSETVGMNVNAVGATALDDVFLGGSSPSGVFGVISHWDGARWYAIRTRSTYVAEMFVFGDFIAYVDGGTTIRHLRRMARW